MGRKKLGLVVGVLLAALAAPVMVAASDTPAEPAAQAAQARSRTTVFDIFELSPEQFATVMSKGDE